MDRGPNIKKIYEQRMQESKEIQMIHVQEQASTKKLRCEYSCHIQGITNDSNKKCIC